MSAHRTPVGFGFLILLGTPLVADSAHHDEAWALARNLVAEVAAESDCELVAKTITRIESRPAEAFNVGVETSGKTDTCAEAVSVLVKRGAKSGLFFLASHRPKAKPGPPEHYDLIHEAAQPD